VLSFPAREYICCDAKIITDLPGAIVAFQDQLNGIELELPVKLLDLPVKTEAFPSFPSGQGIKYTINAGF
jgi:hypothetical protein